MRDPRDAHEGLPTIAGTGINPPNWAHDDSRVVNSYWGIRHVVVVVVCVCVRVCALPCHVSVAHV